MSGKSSAIPVNSVTIVLSRYTGSAESLTRNSTSSPRRRSSSAARSDLSVVVNRASRSSRQGSALQQPR